MEHISCAHFSRRLYILFFGKTYFAAYPFVNDCYSLYPKGVQPVCYLLQFQGLSSASHYSRPYPQQELRSQEAFMLIS